MINLFRTVTVVTVTQVNAYVQTHQHIYTKCIQGFAYQSHFNKVDIYI